MPSYRVYGTTLSLNRFEVVGEDGEETAVGGGHRPHAAVVVRLTGSMPRRSGFQQKAESFPLGLVARPRSGRMRVVMWGAGGVKDVLTELPRACGQSATFA